MMDLLDIKFKKIDPIYKKSFLISFAICIFVYFTLISNLFWGNHDWESVQRDIILNEALLVGRIGATVLTSVFCFKFIPYLIYICSFCISIIASFLIADYWNIKKKVSNLVIFSLFWILMPSTLCYLYYRTDSVGKFGTILFSVLAIKLSLKINDFLKNKNSENITLNKLKAFVCFLASFIFLFIFVIGTYPTTLNTIAVLVIGKFLIDFKISKFKVRALKQTVLEHKYFFFALILSLLAILGTIHLLNNFHIIRDCYAVTFTQNTDWIQRIILTGKLCFSSLVEEAPFVGKFVRMMLLIVLCSSIFTFVKNLLVEKETQIRKIIKLLLLLFLFFSLIYFSFSSYLLCEGIGTLNERILHLGIDFVYLFAVAVILEEENLRIKNFNVILILLAMFNFAVHNMDAQIQSCLQFKNEILFQNRLLTQIVNTDNFDPNNEYTYLQIGQYYPFRDKFYNKENVNIENEELINFNFVSQDGCSAGVRYLSKFDFIKDGDSFAYETDKIYDEQMDAELYDFIMNKAEIYPRKNSIFISDNYILVVFDENYLEQIRQKIKKN